MRFAEAEKRAKVEEAEARKRDGEKARKQAETDRQAESAMEANYRAAVREDEMNSTAPSSPRILITCEVS